MRPLVLAGVVLGAAVALAAAPRQPSTKEKPMKAKATVPAAPAPRLELFREVERPSPAAEQGPRAAPTRVIERCELALPKGGAEALLAEPLELLPYFDHEAAPTTLAGFFAAQADKWGMAHYAMFPKSLWPLHTKLEAKTAALDTLLAPAGRARKQALVVWQGEGLWYVDHVYYRLAKLDVAALTPGPCVDVVAATWDEFVRVSPIIRQRLHEFRDDRRLPDLTMPSPEVAAITLQLTPGMPGTRDYELKIFPDGRVGYQSGALGATPATLKVTPLLVRAAQLLAARAAARKAGTQEREAPPAPFAHDGQQRILRLYVDGHSEHFELTGDSPKPVLAFAAEVAEAFGLDEDPRRAPRSVRP